MSQVVRIPREAMQRKPPHGAPCNQCGACCFATLCQLGEHLFQRTAGPCPAVVKDGKGYACGVVKDPRAYAPNSPSTTQTLRLAALKILYAGQGCDARFNGEWVNRRYHVECSIADAIDRPNRDAALKLWGITP